MLDKIAGAIGIGGPAGATLAGAALGGGLGYLGVKETNASNEAIASARNKFEMEEALKAREFSAGQSKIGRDFTKSEALALRNWQERMSSSAVSRRMADMKKAGINPILAGKFDATTPAGAMGAHTQPATAKANAHGYTAQNQLQGLLSNLGTALSIGKLATEIKNLDAQAEFTGNKSDLTELPKQIMDFLIKAIEGTSATPENVKTGIQDVREYLDGTKREQAKQIRDKPGIELTPYAKERQKDLNRHKNQKGKRGPR